MFLTGYEKSMIILNKASISKKLLVYISLSILTIQVYL